MDIFQVLKGSGNDEQRAEDMNQMELFHDNQPSKSRETSC